VAGELPKTENNALLHLLSAAPDQVRYGASLQNTRFLLQTRPLCKLAPPSRHTLALRAHRHRLSAFARKKMFALARREMLRRARRSTLNNEDQGEALGTC
jgi:hypothetical protein